MKGSAAGAAGPEDPAAPDVAATEARRVASVGVGAGAGEDGGGRGVFGRKMGEQVVVEAGERMGLSWGAATSVAAGRGVGNHGRGDLNVELCLRDCRSYGGGGGVGSYGRGSR